MRCRSDGVVGRENVCQAHEKTPTSTGAGPGEAEVISCIELVQQRAAFGHKQAQLLQLQADTVRLQRLLIEQAPGGGAADIDVAPHLG
jgi:hypothetical protein